MNPVARIRSQLIDRIPLTDSARNVAGEAMLLTAISLVLGLFYVESFVVREDAAFVPRLVIYGTGIFVVLAYFTVIRYRDDWDEFMHIPSSYRDNSDEDEEESKYRSFKLTSALREFSWSVPYVVGMVFIGFFTTNFFFTFAYVYARSDRPTTSRVIEGLVSALVICAGAYILFIHILENYVIFRLGIFV